MFKMLDMGGKRLHCYFDPQKNIPSAKVFAIDISKEVGNRKDNSGLNTVRVTAYNKMFLKRLTYSKHLISSCQIPSFVFVAFRKNMK
jgi:hypothetical protein